MKKINTLKNKEEFTRIIKSRKPYKYKEYIIYVDNSDDSNYQFGISVGKKIGNAVCRNKIKRQIRSIISKKDYQKGIKCIIIIGRGTLNKKFIEKEKDLLDALKNINIIKGEINEK